MWMLLIHASLALVILTTAIGAIILYFTLGALIFSFARAERKTSKTPVLGFVRMPHLAVSYESNNSSYAPLNELLAPIDV